MRTKREIDVVQIEEMAEEFCTQEEIAMDMGFERTMFHRRKELKEAFERGKNTARMSLRHILWNSAKGGDKSTMIFLAKNELGYRDNPEPKEADDKTIEQANKQIAALADLINNPKKERTLDEIEGTMTEEQKSGGDKL